MTIYDGQKILSQEDLDRLSYERDKVLTLIKGNAHISTRSLPEMFERRYGYYKTLNQIRTQVQLLVDEGDVVRVGRGYVGDPALVR